MTRSALQSLATGVPRRLAMISRNLRLLARPSLSLEGQSLDEQEIILAYQMGKVGSSSIVHSLREAGIRSPVFHIHSLSPRALDSFRESLIHPLFLPVPRNLLLSQCVLERIETFGIQGNRWKIVSLTRDPIATVLSSFFQVGRLHFQNFSRRAERGEISMEELSRVFFHEYHKHDWALEWFDREILQVFDIDVFDRPFVSSAGYGIWRTEHVDLLVIRLESLDECGAAAFSDFLGIEDFRLVKANDSLDKPYTATYEQFKNTVRFPMDYLEQCYSHRYSTHFYTEEERSAFRRRWER